MKEKVAKRKKVLKAVVFVGLVFVLSGASLIVIDRYLFPKLVSIEWLSKYKIFKKATENIVVVNKTEQVTVSEEQTISRYSNKSASSVVEVLSRKKKEAKVAGTVAEEPKVGSGLVVTSDGLVITHRGALATEASDYEVITGEEKEYKARIVLQDSFSDLVLLEMESAENLSTVSFIAPEDIRVGAKVVAVGRGGNDAQIIFKSGLISSFAKDFSVGGPVASSEKLQGVYFAGFGVSGESDENIAGSAVADYNGDVVGILGIRKSASSQQYFVIPINYLDGLVKQFIERGAVQRGLLGVYYLLLTKENNARLSDGKEIEKGALVYSPSLQQGLAVISGGAAEKAGIRIMDIILSVSGEEVGADQNLAYLISKYKPGEEIELGILREGKEMKVKAVLQ